MSGQAIVSAAKTILAANIDELVEVQDLDAVPFRIHPQGAPCVLLQLQRFSEVPVAHGKSRVDGDLDLHIWDQCGAPTEETAESFKNLVNTVALELRKHPRMDGLADVAGESQLMISGRRLQTQFTRPIIRPNAVWLHAVITNRVTEFVNTSIV